MQLLRSSLVLALAGLLATSLAVDADAVFNEGVFEKRQNSVGETGATSSRPQSSRTTSTPSPTSRTTTTSNPPTSSPTPSSTPSPSQHVPTSPPATSPVESPPSSTPTPDNPPPSTSDGGERTPSQQFTLSSSPLVALVPTTFTVHTTITLDGSPSVSSFASTSMVPSTTGFTTAVVPSLGSSGDSKNSSGLSDSSKKIIAGVVGGVGGAILLGGIAAVAWRMWGRKRNNVGEDDDLVSGGTDSISREKRQSSAGLTPFQSTLDQYHTPGPKPNAAANF